MDLYITVSKQGQPSVFNWPLDFKWLLILSWHYTDNLSAYLLFTPDKSGIILYMRPANERRRYILTSSLIGWAHTQNDPCLIRYPTMWNSNSDDK